jgi:hypothetical protein
MFTSQKGHFQDFFLTQGYRYKVANFIVAMLQSCKFHSCYVTKLLQYKVATVQSCCGTKVATPIKWVKVPNRQKNDRKFAKYSQKIIQLG